MYAKRLFCTVFFLTFLLSILPVYTQVVINEIQSSNSTTIPDDDGDYEDWIELYNTDTHLVVNLAEYGLSDDPDLPFRWVFPEGTAIVPGGYLLVWASGKDRRNPTQPLHTNFSISQVGETILLSAPSSEIQTDVMPPREIPTDFSYGRKTDGAIEWYFFYNPTPGSSNTGDGYTELPGSVLFSVSGGFHNAPILLEMNSAHTDAEIRYTLNGAEPTITSHLYTEPIYIDDRTTEPDDLSAFLDISHNYANSAPPAENVFKGTVVRARAFRDGALTGPVTTQTYFITGLGNARYSLPVISLSSHRDSLFDYEKGIYVLGKVWYDAGADNHTGGAPANYNRRGEAWERRMHIEVYETDGSQVISQEIGVRLHGGWSRAFPHKSFRLYARSEYGNGRFRYRIFPEMELDNFNRLILRNSGQDVALTLFRDAYIQESVKHMKFETMASRPAIVFINGEYWGIYNIRERYDEDFLATHYGVEGDMVDILTGNSVVLTGSNIHYTQMLQYLQQNEIQHPEHYEHIKTLMDTESFTDYYIAQIFARNTDWPHGNIDFWRYSVGYSPGALIPEQDGRWRWMMYDTDFGFGWQPDLWPSTPQNKWDMPRVYDRRSYTRNMMLQVTNTATDRAWSTYVFRRLITNQTFRNNFMNRFADMLNTTYRPERMVAVLDSMKQVYAPEIQEHMNRWSVTEREYWNFYWRPPITYEEWEGEVGVMEEFARIRPSYQWQHLMEFDNRDTVQITLNVTQPEGGYIRINTIDITPNTIGVSGDPYPWTGTYFTGIPIYVTAQAKAGYRFTGWEEFPDHRESTITITPGSDTFLTANFESNQEQDPPAHRLQDGPYLFNYWPANAEPGTYPDNMIFMHMDKNDPGLDASEVGKTTGRYDLDSRTRINGLGGDGFAFINTSSEEGNPGYPGRRLGAAVLGLDTRGYGGIQISWTGGTILPNSRVYNIRLDYRTDTNNAFKPVLDTNNLPVEYKHNDEAGHSEHIGPITLPEDANDQQYVQLRWRYYFTGLQIDDTDGSRAQLRVSNIEITGTPVSSVGSSDDTNVPDHSTLEQNYPNPFNNKTVISYRLSESASVSLRIYSVLGTLVGQYDRDNQFAGSYAFLVDAGGWASGVYVARLRIDKDNGQSFYLPPIRMTLLR
jgi:hypothetical protein